MIKSFLSRIVFALAFAISPAYADKSPAPQNAKVYFISPSNGEEISGPVKVRFGLTGMGIAPAGTEKKHTGHHHLLIDTQLQDYDNPIPSDAQHRHFGGGQTEVTLDLSPGQHTLQLILADHNHIPHKPKVESAVITITVK